MTTSMMALTWYKFDDVVYNFTLVDNFPTGTPSDQQPANRLFAQYGDQLSPVIRRSGYLKREYLRLPRDDQAFTALNTFLRQFDRLEARVLSDHFENCKRIINPTLEYFWPIYRLECIRSTKNTYGGFSMRVHIDLSPTNCTSDYGSDCE